jgi:hypothetical protein
MKWIFCLPGQIILRESVTATMMTCEAQAVEKLLVGDEDRDSKIRCAGREHLRAHKSSGTGVHTSCVQYDTT